MIISGKRRVPLVYNSQKGKEQQFFKYVPSSLRVIKLGCDCVPSIQSLVVGVGRGNNTMFYSEDGGMTWTGLGKSIFTTQGNGVAYNGSIWVAVGYGTTNTIAYSKDGKNWVGLGNSIISGSGNVVYWNGSIWLVGGNTLAYSSDGINWTSVSLSFNNINSLAWNGSLWVAVGSALTGNQGIAYSSNGITWTNVNDSDLTNLGATNDIVYYDSKFTGVCQVQSSVYTKIYSSDAINWTTLPQVTYGQGSAIEKFNSKYFSTGSGSGAGNSAEISNDGITWTKATDPNLNSLADGVNVVTGRGVFFFCNKKLFLCGYSNLGYTIDGNTWTKFPFPLSGSYITAAYSTT